MPLRSEPVSVLVGLLASLIAAGAAAAEAPAAPVIARLELEAAADCTTEEELVARVAARSQRIRFEPEASGGPTLRATIARTAGGTVVGELTILQPGGKRSARRIAARGCAEAADALALVIAIALDPSLVAGGQAPATAGDQASTGNERSPTAEPPPPPPAVAPADVPNALQPAPTPPATQTRFGAGAFTEALFGPSPRALLGLGVEASVALDRASVWSLLLGLRATHGSRNGLVEPGGTAGFTLDAVSLDACPIRVRFSAIEARGCGTALAGLLSATGSNTYSPRSSARPFVTAGGAMPVTVDLGSRLVVSARASLSASLIRDAFQFTPSVFHRVPSVTLEVDLGLGLRFP